jgi:predicted O-methyltransferase YrrM
MLHARGQDRVESWERQIRIPLVVNKTTVGHMIVDFLVRYADGRILAGKFDLVFMDANKDGYLEQIQELIRLKLLAPNCLIIADNVIDRRAECQNFLDFMEQFNPVILQTECGLLVGRI